MHSISNLEEGYDRIRCIDIRITLETNWSLEDSKRFWCLEFLGSKKVGIEVFFNCLPVMPFYRNFGELQWDSLHECNNASNNVSIDSNNDLVAAAFDCKLIDFKGILCPSLLLIEHWFTIL